MFYTIYKVTNTVNGKYYIGKHQTKDLNDGYMGSGKRLKSAIKKYGQENFQKEILHIVQTEKEMDLLEKILVVPDQEINYNLCEGGKGGWSYINSNKLTLTKKHRKAAKKNLKLGTPSFIEKFKDENFRIKHSKNVSIGMKKFYKTGTSGFKGRKHSIKTKEKISRVNKLKLGNLNSQYGTCWITNGQVNKKIKKEELDNWLELGYYKGRI